MRFQVTKHMQNAILEKERESLYPKQVLALLRKQVAGEEI